MKPTLNMNRHTSGRDGPNTQQLGNDAVAEILLSKRVLLQRLLANCAAFAAGLSSAVSCLGFPEGQRCRSILTYAPTPRSQPGQSYMTSYKTRNAKVLQCLYGLVLQTGRQYAVWKPEPCAL